MNALSYKNGFLGCSVVLMAALLAGGCGTVLGEPADDPGGTGSIFRIALIEPYYFGEVRYQVDLTMNQCDTGSGSFEDEQWGDHFATVTFTNEPLPNAEEQTASNIYLYRYSFTFTPHNLDAQAANIGTPNSPVVVPLTQTVTIPPCAVGADCEGTSYSAVFMMPMETKNELVALYALQGWTPWDGGTGTGLPQTEYCAHYTFYGENAFGVDVTVSGSTCFLADEYNYCD